MTDHVLTYLCASGREVVSHHLERLRTLRDEGFVVHVCAGEDASFERLRGEGFVVRELPAFGGARNPAAALLVWSHLIEHRPTLLHGFAGWAPLAALAAQHLQPTATFVTLEDASTPLWAAPPGLLGVLGKDLSEWIGRQVDGILVRNEAVHAALARSVAPSKLHLIAGSEGVVVPESLTRGNRGIVTCTEGMDADARKRLAAVRKAVRKRHPRVDWRNAEGEAFGDAIASADLLVDLGGVGPGPTLAAGAWGVPCVALHTPDTVHIVESGRTGVLVHDDEALAKSAIELLDHPKLRKEMGLAARTRIESRFQRRDVDSAIMELYASTLREKMGR